MTDEQRIARQIAINTAQAMEFGRDIDGLLNAARRIECYLLGEEEQAELASEAI